MKKAEAKKYPVQLTKREASMLLMFVQRPSVRVENADLIKRLTKVVIK